MVFARSMSFVAVSLVALSFFACAADSSRRDGSGGSGGDSGWSQSSSSSSSGGAGGLVHYCDTNTADCGDCVFCSTFTDKGNCTDEWDACAKDFYCKSYDACYDDCNEDSACILDCGAKWSEAIPIYTKYRRCLGCDECATMCAGLISCQ